LTKFLKMNKSGNHIIIKDIGFSLLAEGTTIKVKADGYSMYPVIKPGSVVFIEPLPGDMPPFPGEIIAWKRESGFVVHRLVKIIRNGSNICFITKGDSCANEDQPVERTRIAGKVIRIEEVKGRSRKAEELFVKPCYVCNRLIVWVLIRLKRLINLGSL
jgi:signal peptidase I